MCTNFLAPTGDIACDKEVVLFVQTLYQPSLFLDKEGAAEERWGVRGRGSGVTLVKKVAVKSSQYFVHLLSPFGKKYTGKKRGDWQWEGRKEGARNAYVLG